jgi:copper chaperone CopZ
VVEAVSTLPGVRTAEVDLASHLLRIGSDEPVDLGKLREAVAEAGYELVASAEQED